MRKTFFLPRPSVLAVDLDLLGNTEHVPNPPLPREIVEQRLWVKVLEAKPMHARSGAADGVKNYKPKRTIGYISLL